MGEEPVPNDALWAKFKNPIVMPLMTKIPMSGFDRPYPVDPAVVPNLVVQMDSMSGKHFIVSLTVEAAQKLISVLKYDLELAGFGSDGLGARTRTTH